MVTVASTPRPLALLGGTFDPVHLGHLRVAWEAAEALDAEVRLLPARAPPHRPQPIASAEARVALLRAALAGQDRLGLDLRELARPGPSYSVDTLTELRAEQGTQRPLLLLLGQDAFAGLPTWRRWMQLFQLAHIVVLTRPASLPIWPDSLQQQWRKRAVTAPAALRATPAGAVFNLRVSALEISASQVRALLAAGREPRYLLPDALLADAALLAPYRASAR
ncbi:nicotinate-nucleotide adenylyltransferase [Metallibacterium sp.]|uniref:nicotinate-nucleotide adenylyltransferase n=1 Tax=Metallibacterium sp. TaxID=2940281 RepID=UPI0026041A3F|nr:nicotinate-nucleotide adenylyltransferase [Metallibacterium sp.]